MRRPALHQPVDVPGADVAEAGLQAALLRGLVLQPAPQRVCPQEGRSFSPAAPFKAAAPKGVCRQSSIQKQHNEAKQEKTSFDGAASRRRGVGNRRGTDNMQTDLKQIQE